MEENNEQKNNMPSVAGYTLGEDWRETIFNLLGGKGKQEDLVNDIKKVISETTDINKPITDAEAINRIDKLMEDYKKEGVGKI